MSTPYVSTAGITLHAAAPLPRATVQLQGLQLRYGTHTVLDGLDWQLLPGQVVGLLGRNGAGKTTLLEALLGLRDPSAGTAQLFGQPVAQLDDAARARIGYAPQQAELFEWLTPAQLLAYFRSFYSRWNETKVEGLLSRWDINRDTPIAKLSGGQKQRLSIIRALAHEPDLLVLDEPVASLDPVGRRDFLRELVEQVLDRGTTVVFSTHILSDLERVAFNIAFLNRGRIALQAPLDELMDTCRLVTGPGSALQSLAQQPGVQSLASQPLDGGRARSLLRFHHGVPALPATLMGQAPTLEDLFLALTQ